MAVPVFDRLFRFDRPAVDATSGTSLYLYVLVEHKSQPDRLDAALDELVVAETKEAVLEKLR